MSHRLIFGMMGLRPPGHYGPHCGQCNAPIMFNKIRKRNGKCDTCNGFKVHQCGYEQRDQLMHDPNKENMLSTDFWLDNGVWYGELDIQYNTQDLRPIYHFRVLNCPFCGILLKDLEK